MRAMFQPQEIDPLVRLWYHECCRVFQDRLVNDEDREWFDQLLREKIGGFGINADKVLGDRVILFGDFLEPQSDVKNYEEIMDMEKLSKVLDQYLEDYNHHSTAPMKLVLFLDAISHVCRISRIIRQPLGNALLLGMGGSGKLCSLGRWARVPRWLFTVMDVFSKMALARMLFSETGSVLLTISNQLSLHFDFDPKTNLIKIQKSPYAANILLGLSSQMYIYTDIVDPQIMGDIVAPLLRIVGISYTNFVNGIHKTVSYTPMQDVPVLRCEIESLEINIGIDTGEPVPFEFGKKFLKLHF
ncbi:unnamed protein product [Timema podura]|uniref:Dynein heavy chain n=1 Tax=Timema podura TaxID=61482 RepID=A0ABN7NM48_TIMPD|nr:unnamed protein product [Timema podura]